MHRRRGKLFSWLTDWAVRLSRRHDPTPQALAHARSRDFSSNTSRIGVRFTDFLRNRLRTRWLRIRRPDPPADHPE